MRKKDYLENRKMAVSDNKGGWLIRVHHRKKRKLRQGVHDPRYLLKCGCCDEKVEIYYGGGFLEINGVHGSVENWKALLLPLLK